MVKYKKHSFACIQFLHQADIETSMFLKYLEDIKI